MSEKQLDNMAIIGDNCTTNSVSSDALAKDDLEEKAVSSSGTRPIIENTNAPKLKKSGFKITSVTKKVASKDINTDGDGDSIDDILDESHTEDVNSELYDNSKMTDCDHDSLPEDNLHLTPDETVKEKVVDAGGPSRFKVVKIETNEPFKRGRWICHDFLEPTMSDKISDKTDVIKLSEEPQSGNSSGSSSVNYVQGVDDPTKNPLLVNSQVLNQVVNNSTNLQHSDSTSSMKGHLVNPNVGAQHSVINTPPDFQQVIQPSSQKPTPSQIPNMISAPVGQSEKRTDATQMIGHGATNIPGQVPVSLSQSLGSQIQQNIQIMHTSPLNTAVNSSQHVASSLSSSQVLSTQRSAVMSPNVPNSPQVIPVSNTMAIHPSSNSMQAGGPLHKQTVMPSPISEQTPINAPLVSSNLSQSNVIENFSNTNIHQQARKAVGTSTMHTQVSDTNPESLPTSGTSNMTCGNSHVPYSIDVTVNHIEISDIGNGDAVRYDPKKGIDKIDGGAIASSDHPLSDTRPTHLGVSGVGLLTPLAAAVGGLTSVRDDKDGSGTSTVTIDNRIEQAMDLVKSHLKFAVREEVEVLREQIVDLVKKNTQLEQENSILKSGATAETLAKLTNQSRPAAPPSSS